MKKSLLAIALLVFLAACSGNVPAATMTPTARPSATPTQTETPTETPTPEPAKPAVASNLSPQNAASEIYENGAWVDKNAAGKITATWDSAKGEWGYSMENITTAYGIVGWPEKLPIELSRETHPECFDRAPHDESLSLKDEHGAPYPDGYVWETSDGDNIFAARFVSSFNLNSNEFASIVCAQVDAAPDKALIIPLFLMNLPHAYMTFRSYKLVHDDPMQREAIGLTNPQTWEMIRKLLPGQQFIFILSKNEPLDTFFTAMKNPSGFSGQTLTVSGRIIYYEWGFPERFFTP